MSNKLQRFLSVLSTRNGLMSVAVAFVVATVGLTLFVSHADTISVWSTNFEDGSKRPTYSNTVDWLYNVTGTSQGQSPQAELSHDEHHSGIYAMRYSGIDQSSASSFAYMKSYAVTIPVTADTQFSYWIRANNELGKCVTLDLHFTDGTTLHETGAKDQNGVTVAASGCHGVMSTGNWTNIQTKLGQWAAGRTIDKIWVVYDHAKDVGSYEGYIDDIEFTRSLTTTVANNISTQPGTNGKYSAKFWNYSGAPVVPSSNPTYQTSVDTISNDWGGGSPNASIANDHFIGVWNRTQDFEAGTYLFTVTADDGVRLYIDGKSVIDQWKDQGPTTYSNSQALTGGQHTIMLQYYENGGGAVMKFNYQKTTTTTTAPAPVVTTPAPATPVTPAPPVASSNPLYGLKIFNNTADDPAVQQVAQWQSSRPADAAQINKIATTPRAEWMGGWSGDIKTATNSLVSNAAAQNSVPVLIAYNIPNRDCGNYSAGGVGSASEYIAWITGMANGINGRKAVVVLEPDALGLITCMGQADQDARYSMLSQATSILRAKGAYVYIEASTWISTSDMATRLNKAGIANANGFALNVSGFNTTSSMVSYGNDLSGKVGNKHFIIDTSRNGNGPTSDSQWCNPMGRALGDKPNIFTSGSIDAYLWLKKPGESDGNCNGGPNAGAWWPDYALGLAQRAKY